LAPVPIRERNDFEPSVSVCLTVCNGERHLAEKLESLLQLEYPAEKLEILVFSDGSTDDTERILSEYASRDPRIRFASSAERLGKPSALNHLLELATGDVLLLCDVRQTMSRNALRELLRPLADPSVGCVSGSLVLAGATGAGMYWRYEQLIRSSEARIGGMVGVSGSIYATRRADMPRLPNDILLDDMFVPLCVALSTRKRVVLAESARAFDLAYDDEREFVRKVRTLAGNFQLFSRLPRLLVPGVNPVWFQLVSHKLFRLLCPWALCFLFVSSGALALAGSTFFALLFLAQAACYGLALAGARAGALGVAARTFVILNAAAMLGLWRFLRGSQAVTWKLTPR
jgi:cellulose synthase/poly-beta-1,6-N-acetylglucosamine synthase-like glycosyltransferase